MDIYEMYRNWQSNYHPDNNAYIGDEDDWFAIKRNPDGSETKVFPDKSHRVVSWTDEERGYTHYRYPYESVVELCKQLNKETA